MKLKDLKKYNLGGNSGVYYFLKGKDILYIGKATNLKDRIKSYFGKDLINTRGPLIVDMVFKAGSIRWQETDSVLEALIKEANEIKKYQPYYNTKEKDDKSFNYVYITRDFKLGTIRGRQLLNSKKSLSNFFRVFGPFPNGGQLKEALKIIRKFFPYIEDKKGAKGREEFYKQIKLNPENSIENKKNIKNIILFFEGKKKRIITLFKKEMQFLAKEKKFEEANEIKRKIFALEHINDIALIKEDKQNQKQNYPLRPSRSVLEGQVLSSRSEYSYEGNFVPGNFRFEAYDIAHLSGKNMVGVMVVLENGELKKDEYRKFKIKNQDGADDTKALKEVLERRFNHKEWSFPEVVIVDGGLPQINIAKKVLKDRNLNIKVLSVLKNEKHKPKAILGGNLFSTKHEKQILLLNSEAHRFAIKYHKQMRGKNFLR